MPRSDHHVQNDLPAEPREDTGSEELRQSLRGIFEIRDVTYGLGRGKAVRFRGRLLIDSESAYSRVAEGFGRLGYTPVFRNTKEGDIILAVQGVPNAAATRKPVAVVLLTLTILSMLFAGADAEIVETRGWLWGLLSGWPFAVSLMAILLAHELGHYFVARHYGVPVSLPYFIPMPLNVLGTMGAFIQMKAPPRNRRELLMISVAGPLAGLIVAIPVLILGLSLSSVEPLPVGGGYFVEGNSLLYLAMKFLVFGRILPGGGEDVFLHNVALAGWAGLLVTALNLLPAGQLDGGHVVYALLGENARRFNWLVICVLVAMGFLWNGWFIWAGLVFIFSRFVAAPLDDVTGLSSRGKTLAVVMILIFLLLLTPIPFKIVPATQVVPGTWI